MDASNINDIDCVGDCVEVIGEPINSDKSDNKDFHENGAFPKTRYHVEGKPNGISVLQARKSLLKKQLRAKGLNLMFHLYSYYLYILLNLA